MAFIFSTSKVDDIRAPFGSEPRDRSNKDATVRDVIGYEWNQLEFIHELHMTHRVSLYGHAGQRRQRKDAAHYWHKGDYG